MTNIIRNFFDTVQSSAIAGRQGLSSTNYASNLSTVALISQLRKQIVSLQKEVQGTPAAQTLASMLQKLEQKENNNIKQQEQITTGAMKVNTLMTNAVSSTTKRLFGGQGGLNLQTAMALAQNLQNREPISTLNFSA